MAAIIFDFDGTIADSFDFVADFLADEAGIAALKPQQRQELRGLSMLAMARRLKRPWWRLPKLLFQGRQRMQDVITQIEPFDGIPELIRKLHAEGHELFILSTNSVHNIHAFLHQHQLHEYFLEIYGGVSLFSKAPALRGLLKEQNIEKADAVCVGDETRDLQAARSVGVRAVAVTWGFAKPADLKRRRPTALANTPAELMKILEEI